RQTTAAKFAVDLERRGPEPGAVADGYAADRIDHGECRHQRAAGSLRRRRAEAALQRGRRGAHAGTDASEREVLARRRGGRIAEIAIGRKAPPFLVAAVEQIEADRARHDRNHGLADFQAATLLGE